MINKDFEKEITAICAKIETLPLEQRIEALNFVRGQLHKISPFKSEPTDFVKWVPARIVHANEYNPNRVARPEMELLFVSIKEDGITMPIVAIENDGKEFEIVDGFHRHQTVVTRREISDRTFGYVPLSVIKKTIDARMASTIRHNRARGKHAVEPMAAIVVSLIQQNWTDTEIAEHLGMEAEEVLRLKQIEGIASVLANKNYDRAWEVEK